MSEFSQVLIQLKRSQSMNYTGLKNILGHSACEEPLECFHTVVYMHERAPSMNSVFWNKEGKQDLKGFEWRRKAEGIDK